MPSVSIDTAIDSVQRLCLRFPYALAASVVMAAVAIRSTWQDHHWHWVAALVAAFTWSAALRLNAEGRGWPRTWLWLLPLLPAAILAAPLLVSREMVTLPLLMLAVSGAGFAVAAPMLSKLAEKSAIAAIWGRSLCFAIALAGAGTLILCLGLSLLLAGTNALFDVKIGMTNGFGYIWTIGFYAIFPSVFLALLPDFSQVRSSFAYPKWLAVLVDWLLSPLVLAHLALLNGYCVFILVQGSMPKGVIGLFVTGVTIAGGIGWCAAYAAGDEGGKSSRLLSKLYFPAMIAPAIALLFATVIRVQDHGVTEQRYLLLLKAAALLVLGGYQLLRRRVPDPSQAAILPAVLMLLASVSATGLSVRSQTGHLQAVLERVGHFKDGHVVADGPVVSRQDGFEISSATVFLLNHGQLNSLLVWFTEPPSLSANEWQRNQSLVKAMGVPFILNKWAVENDGGPHFHVYRNSTIDLVGYLTLINLEYNKMRYIESKTAYGVLSAAGGERYGLIRLMKDGVEWYRVDLSKEMARIADGQPFTLTGVTADGARLKLVVQSINETSHGADGNDVTNLNGYLLIGPADKAKQP